MTATPLGRQDPEVKEVDLGLTAVLAVAWLVAAIATSLTLWLLVGVFGNA